MTTVLVCDDEPQILRALRVVLREAGFEVVLAENVAEALDRASVRPPDAAILDLVLPDGTGIDICRELRRWSQMPILVLSASDDEDAKVEALEAGADDYVTKPFAARELVARLKAALRRVPGDATSAHVLVGDLDIDLPARRITRAGAEVHLTPIEHDLMVALLRHRGRLLTHRTLLVAVWGPGYSEDVPVLRTHLANLRRKLGAEHIKTDPGVGYRWAT